MPLGPQELMLIFVAIILLFGASKLPELARSMGKSMGEFKKAQREVEKELRQLEIDADAEPEKMPAKNKVQVMAEELGIETEGKTEDQILDEIKAAMHPREEANP